MRDPDALTAARAYLERGWRPTPNAFKTKRAILGGWQGLALTAKELPQHFANGRRVNVGVVLGEASGGLLDADLDSEAAVALAPYFLPHTDAIFGRPGKPRSHWLYAVEKPLRRLYFPEPGQREIRDPNKKKMIVELRGSGHQTIFPGSVHELDEPIRWDRDGEPARVDVRVLVRAVHKIAAAALLVPYWRSGVRNDLMLHLAGTLVWAGWPEQEATQFIVAIAAVTHDDERSPEVITKQVGVARAKRAAGDAVTGLPTLEKLIGNEEVSSNLRTWISHGPPEAASAPMMERSSPRGAGQREGQSADEREVLISRQGCAIVREDLNPLWDGFIYYGKLSVALGLPDVGKSFATLYLVTQQSRGGRLPRATGDLQVADCLIASTEDDFADTIAPRLDWLEADGRRWWTMEGIRRDEEQRPLYLDRDLLRIEQTITQRQAKLVVFDPFSGFLDYTNPTRDTEVRRVVAPLAAIAKRTGAAIIVVTHIKKGTEDTALYRALNSVALVAQARSALAFAVDPDDETRRVIVPIKGNLNGRAEPIGFRITPIEGTKKATIVFDNDPVSVTWQTVFSAPAAGTDREADKTSALEEARDYLLSALGAGRQPVKAVLRDAEENGIKATTLRRAREALGVQTTRESFGAPCYWQLPALCAPPEQQDPQTDEPF